MGLTGSDLVARALQRQGVDTFFYLMGAPMLSVEAAALALGLRGIDVRHEQAAAMAAHAYARLLNRPGRLHGGLRAGHRQPGDRGGARLGGRHAGRRARRLGAGERERARHLPGDRPARDDGALHQMGRPGVRGAADPRDDRPRDPGGDERQAGAGLSRPARRRALRRGGRGGGGLARALGPGGAPAAGGGRGGDRGLRRDAGRGGAAGGRLRQRALLVRRGGRRSSASSRPRECRSTPRRRAGGRSRRTTPSPTSAPGRWPSPRRT